MQRCFVGAVLAVLTIVATCALAQNIPYNTVSGRTPTVAFIGNLADGDQYIIRDGVSGGRHYWDWDATANTVDLGLEFSGLPTPSIEADFDASNAYNQFPSVIHGGRWRLAIVHHLGLIPITFYRWQNGTLAGSEYDYYGNANLPSLPGVYTEQNVASIMLMTDWIDTIGDDSVNQTFAFQYDRFQDFRGTTGVVYGHVNVTDGDLSTMINIYSNPDAMVKPAPSFSFGDVLSDINAGGAIGILPTYQPIRESPDLKGRDSIFRGPFAMMGASLAGPFGPRLADTAACFAAYAGTPSQQANVYAGNVQLKNWFLSACVLSLPSIVAKRSVDQQQQPELPSWTNKGVVGFLNRNREL